MILRNNEEFLKWTNKIGERGIATKSEAEVKIRHCINKSFVLLNPHVRSHSHFTHVDQLKRGLVDFANSDWIRGRARRVKYVQNLNYLISQSPLLPLLDLHSPSLQQQLILNFKQTTLRAQQCTFSIYGIQPRTSLDTNTKLTRGFKFV